MIELVLIDSLRRPEAYPHAVDAIRLVETHISWVLLTGRYAYKIKKPLSLPFLDFSTLARRRHYCEEELRLNRRTAEELYLAVVAIGGTPDQPRVGGPGTVLEYAVKMRQFPADRQLDRMLEQGRLQLEDVLDFAANLARFHASVERGPKAGYGTPEQIAETMLDNLGETGQLLQGAETALLEPVADWLRRRLKAQRATLLARLDDGMVRDCHGDLHLSNLVKLDSGVNAFDCIEFNPAMRWIDVIDDAAFLWMDLDVRGRSDLAYRFGDAYLADTGDYAAVRLLDLYLVHRSLVRAKVAGLARDQLHGSERDRAGERLDRHLRLAHDYVQPRRPRLVLMHGLSGSGKSWLAERLIAALPALRLRSDVERKRLVGLGADARTDSPPGGGLYSAEYGRRTYDRLAELTREILAGGRHVIVDATFLDRPKRRQFLELADTLGVGCTIVACSAPQSVLERRIVERAETAGEASEADLAVLARQSAGLEPIAGDERRHVIEVDTNSEISPEGLADAIRTH